MCSSDLVDQILVIEDGSISQKGTHNELMKQIGLYKKLWDMQYQTEKWKIYVFTKEKATYAKGQCTSYI